MRKRRDYEELPDIELSPELDRRVREMTAEADKQIAEARVNFRWGNRQLAVVKRAAGLAGIPYQTYIKDIVFRQAVIDLRNAREASVTTRGAEVGPLAAVAESREDYGGE